MESSRDDNLPERLTRLNDTEMETEKEREKETSSAAPTYPSNQKRILIMMALYLAVFLVTLVRTNAVSYYKSPIITRTVGPKHHIDSDTAYYG
jgi:hypothetical protein